MLYYTHIIVHIAENYVNNWFILHIGLRENILHFRFNNVKKIVEYDYNNITILFFIFLICVYVCFTKLIRLKYTYNYLFES